MVELTESFETCYVLALHPSSRPGDAMLKGTLNYVAGMTGLQFDGLEVMASAGPAVVKVQLASDGKHLQIAIHFRAVGSQDEARTLANRIIEPILDRLTFAESRAIAFLREVSGAFSEIGGGGSVHNVSVSDTLGITDRFTAIRTMHANSVAQLKATLERAAPAGEKHYAAFRQALNTEELVDRYLSLYRILADLRRDPGGQESQRDVDEFIHAEFAEPLVPRPGRPRVLETVFTRLRNEVNHVRPDVIPDRTRQEIRNHLPRLISIVKRAIEMS
jgi:hypothetical protein